MTHKSPTVPTASLKRAPRQQSVVLPLRVDPDPQLDLFEREALSALSTSPRRPVARAR